MSKLIWFLVFLLLVVLISETDKVESSYAGSASAIINPSKVKQISWNPRSLSLFAFFSLFIFQLKFTSFYDTQIHVMCRAFVYQGFLTDLECDHLISLVRS
jgi:prolyl 4-hydroxylase